MKKFRFGLGLA